MGNILGALQQGAGAPQEAAAALRSKARDQARQRADAFERSKAAYAAGDHAGAKHWSERGKAAGAKMAALNQQAADTYYRANNASRPPGEVDLHGLHVSEAVAAAERAVRDARARGEKRLTLIVGRGLHSADGVARLRPALAERLVRQHSLRVTPGVPNEGCLLVELVRPEQAGWVERIFGGGGGSGGGGGCVIC